MNLFLDSFDHYVTADLTQKWTSISNATISSAAGRRSSQGLRLITGGHYVSKTLVPSGATFICGFSLNAAGFPTTQAALLRLYDSGVNQHVTINLTSAGLFEARRGTVSGTLLGTSATGISAGVTNYIEIKITVDNSAGVVQIMVNGVSILNLTAQDTQNAGTASWVQFDLVNASSSGDDYDFDDLYVNDGSGTVNNGFNGDTRVECHYPNTNGNSNMSTPSTGTDRYATIDEALVSGDTDYNTIASVNDKDTVNVENLKATGATIKSVSPFTNASSIVAYISVPVEGVDMQQLMKH